MVHPTAAIAFTGRIQNKLAKITCTNSNRDSKRATPQFITCSDQKFSESQKCLRPDTCLRLTNATIPIEAACAPLTHLLVTLANARFMQIILCPGIHPPELTEAFVRALSLHTPPLIFPATQPVYSSGHILAFLLQHLGQASQPSQTPSWNPLQIAETQTTTQAIKTTPVLWIGFSAGVVGAIGAAHLWQKIGGRVVALIAFDGWGVPLLAPFPIHRLSHDAFTHWSSAVLGAGQTSFYAEPEVAHLELWRSPQHVHGWAVHPSGYTNTTAAQFVTDLIQQYATNMRRS